MIQMSRTQILPAAIRYQGELAATCANMKAAGCAPTTGILDDVTDKLRTLQVNTEALEKALSESNGNDTLDTARQYADKILPCMNATREAADYLETVVADDLWPLPSYQEMLFIK